MQSAHQQATETTISGFLIVSNELPEAFENIYSNWNTIVCKLVLFNSINSYLYMKVWKVKVIDKFYKTFLITNVY